MTTLQDLVDEQNRVWNRMQEIMDLAEKEDRDLTAEERTNWDQAEQRLTEVSGDIDRRHRMAALEQVDRTQHAGVVDTGESRDSELSREDRYRDAFTAYLTRGMAGLSHDQQAVLAEGENRALDTAPGEVGGYLVPEGFRNVLQESLIAFGGLLGEVEVITTSTGNPLPWPTANETGNKGRIIKHNTQVADSNISFGQRQLGAHTYSSDMVRVPLQLLQDSAFSLESWLPPKLGERIGRAVAEHLATGTGTDEPKGLATAATVGATGAPTGEAGATITYDDLVDLEHSVNSAYRPRAKYVLSDAMLKLVRKLKDTQGRPLWQPVPVPGMPPTINGISYTIDDAMPAPGAGAKSILFGDLRAAYIARQVQGVQLMQLRERYADYLQVGFTAFSRFDGIPDDPQAVRAFQHGDAPAGS